MYVGTYSRMHVSASIEYLNRNAGTQVAQIDTNAQARPASIEYQYSVFLHNLTSTQDQSTFKYATVCTQYKCWDVGTCGRGDVRPLGIKYPASSISRSRSPQSNQLTSTCDNVVPSTQYPLPINSLHVVHQRRKHLLHQVENAILQSHRRRWTA